MLISRLTMLCRLYIQNFALIDQLEIGFSSGLNILTGETGAGKSILLGAIGLILGRRADTSVVISDEKCIVEAEFRLDESQLRILHNSYDDFDVEGDTLILRREISKSGKSRAFINDSPVNLQTLKSVTEPLIDIHGQHDGQLLMDEEVQLEILDQYASITDQVIAFGRQLAEWKKIEKQILELQTQESEAKRQTDYYQFQVQELQKAELNIEEETQIEQELQLLENAGLIGETLSKAVYILDEADESVCNQLSGLIKSLDKIAPLSKNITSESQKIADALTLLNDAALEMQAIQQNLDVDPRRLEYLNERINVINRLKLKYNTKTVSELINIQKEFEDKIQMYDSIEGAIIELQKESQNIAEKLIVKGLEIERLRIQAANDLSETVLNTLKEVGLIKTNFRIEVTRLITPNGYLSIDGSNIQPTSKGINTVRFMVQTNLGLPWGALAQVASGGEISRVMLAIKSALAEKMKLSVLIFDEIDTGISGEVARKVGRVMEKLSEKHQILTITHLPQIASRGKHHFFIYKEMKNERIISQIRKLNLEERVLEIAKMMSGENPTPNALQSARESLSLN